MEVKLEAEAQAANAEFNELQNKLSTTSEPEKTRIYERMIKLDDIRCNCLRKLRQIRASKK